MAQSNDWLTDTPYDPDKERAKKWLTQNPQPAPITLPKVTVASAVAPIVQRPVWNGQGMYQPGPGFSAVQPRPLVQQQGRNYIYNYNPNTAQVVPATSNQTAYDQYYRGLYGQPQTGYSGQGTYQPGPGFTAVQPRTQQDFLRAEWNGYVKPRTQQDFRKADEQSMRDFYKYFTDQQAGQTTGGGGGGYYDPYAGGGYGGGGGGYDTSQRWWLNPSVWRI